MTWSNICNFAVLKLDDCHSLKRWKAWFLYVWMKIFKADISLSGHPSYIFQWHNMLTTRVYLKHTAVTGDPSGRALKQSIIASKAVRPFQRSHNFYRLASSQDLHILPDHAVPQNQLIVYFFLIAHCLRLNRGQERIKNLNNLTSFWLKGSALSISDSASVDNDSFWRLSMVPCFSNFDIPADRLCIGSKKNKDSRFLWNPAVINWKVEHTGLADFIELLSGTSRAALLGLNTENIKSHFCFRQGTKGTLLVLRWKFFWSQ